MDGTIQCLPFVEFQQHAAWHFRHRPGQHRGIKNPPGNDTIQCQAALQALAACQLAFFNTTPAFQNAMPHFDVIVTTHKTIALGFHTQVYKLKRDMTPLHAASTSSVAFMHNDGMEVNDESPAHSPTADCGRPTPVGAPPQGAHNHSGTPGGQSWK